MRRVGAKLRHPIERPATAFGITIHGGAVARSIVHVAESTPCFSQRRIAELRGGGSGAQVAAEGLTRDTAVFDRSMNGLRNGGADIQRVTAAGAVGPLNQAFALWQEMKKDLTALNASSRNLIGAQTAANTLATGSNNLLADSQKLLNRVRRLRGQVDAIERGLQAQAGCTEIMRLLTAARGAINGMMAEVVEDHIQMHMVEAGRKPSRDEKEAADELADQIEDAFAEWANDPRFICDAHRRLPLGGLLGMAFRHRMADGEAFAVLHWDDDEAFSTSIEAASGTSTKDRQRSCSAKSRRSRTRQRATM